MNEEEFQRELAQFTERVREKSVDFSAYTLEIICPICSNKSAQTIAWIKGHDIYTCECKHSFDLRPKHVEISAFEKIAHDAAMSILNPLER